MTNLFNRMIKAAWMDPQTYEDVEADPATMRGALFIVLAASVAGAVGSGVRDIAGLIGVTIFSLAMWAVWVSLTYVIGTRLLPGRATRSGFREIFRTTGFSASPGILRVFGSLPLVGVPILLGVTLWMLCTFVVAIRQALDYEGTARAAAVCVLGWLIQGIVFFAFVLTAV